MTDSRSLTLFYTQVDKIPHEYVPFVKRGLFLPGSLHCTSRPLCQCTNRTSFAISSWLFPQIDAALHHGGAGTTGASLRGELVGSLCQFPRLLMISMINVLRYLCYLAGIPTLIKPWFGDQFFWSVRVTKLGAGLRVQSLASSDLAHAMTKATTDR